MVIYQYPGGKRAAVRPNVRYSDQVEKDLKVLKIKNWNTPARNRTEWKKKII